MFLNVIALFPLVSAQSEYISTVLSDLSEASLLGLSAEAAINNWDGSTGVASAAFTSYVVQVESAMNFMQYLTVFPDEVMESYASTVEQLPDIMAAIVSNLGAISTSASDQSEGVFNLYIYNFVMSELIWQLTQDCSSWQNTYEPEAYDTLTPVFSTASSVFSWNSCGTDHSCNGYYFFTAHTCSATSTSPASTSSAASTSPTLTSGATSTSPTSTSSAASTSPTLTSGATSTSPTSSPSASSTSQTVTSSVNSSENSASPSSATSANSVSSASISGFASASQTYTSSANGSSSSAAGTSSASASQSFTSIANSSSSLESSRTTSDATDAMLSTISSASPSSVTTSKNGPTTVRCMAKPPGAESKVLSYVVVY